MVHGSRTSGISVVTQRFVHCLTPIPLGLYSFTLPSSLQGGLEFLTHSTTLSTPFAQYRPPTLPPDLPSVQIMAVDILPSSIPLDASRHFSNALYPYLDSLIDSYVHGPEASTNQLYGQALERATIATGGKLSGKHEWLMEGVSAWRATQQALKQETISDTQVPWSNDIFVPGEHAQEASHGVLKRKRVLMLGSGMVAGPAVEKIAERSDVELLIGLFIRFICRSESLSDILQPAIRAWRWRNSAADTITFSTGKLTLATEPAFRSSSRMLMS